MKSYILNGPIMTSLICSMIENVVMTIGIMYCSVHFNRFSLLWFLLMPLANSTGLRLARAENKAENEENDR